MSLTPRFGLRSLFWVVLACAIITFLYTCFNGYNEHPRLFALRKDIRNAQRLEILYYPDDEKSGCDYFTVPSGQVLRRLSERRNWPRGAALNPVAGPAFGIATYSIQIVTASGARRHLLFWQGQLQFDGIWVTPNCSTLFSEVQNLHRSAAANGRLTRNASMLLMTGIQEDLDKYEQQRVGEMDP